MKPHQIQQLRRSLNESADQFGARFRKSGRTVEAWEAGRNAPDPTTQMLIDQLAESMSPKRKSRRA